MARKKKKSSYGRITLSSGGTKATNSARVQRGHHGKSRTKARTYKNISNASVGRARRVRKSSTTW